MIIMLSKIINYILMMICLLTFIIDCTNSSLLLFHRLKSNSNSDLFKSWSDEITETQSETIYVLPPNLPERFYNEFTIYYTPRDDDEMPLPPWPTNYPPKLPYAVGRGSTWYADDLGIMIEYYKDYCVPIFEPSSYFPCMIFNYNQTAYFISPEFTGYGPCCIYRKPWFPPPRNFMQQFTNYFNGTSINLGFGVFNQSIDWWIIPNSNRNLKQTDHVRKHPIFGGYGWASKPLENGVRPQVCFWYEGNIGWAQQLFENFIDSGPNVDYLNDFQLPDICQTEMACLFRP